MAQQQALSPTQLAWVREPLSDLLKQVRIALESQDNDAGNANYSGALQHLGQLSATLRMLGIDGAAHAIDEMRELAGDLAHGRVEDPEQEALGTLLGGTVVVDDYLDRLQIGQTDLPLVLLPLVNDIRAARGKSLLPEGVFFKPRLPDEMPPTPLFADRLEERDLPRLRQLYQTFLRNWLRLEKNEAPLRRLMVIADALANASPEIPEQRMWRVAVVVIHGFLAGHVHAGIGIKRLLVRLDLHLKRLLDEASSRQRQIDESNLLTRSLLFYLAMAEPGNAAVEAVSEHYRLRDLLPDRTVLDQAWGSVRGRNREVFESVAKGVLDELLGVKDVLDLQMRAAAIDPSAIQPLGVTLNNAANTLEMLNVASAAELVRGESQRLNSLVDQPDKMDQEALIDVATSLLQVEAHIQRAADAMGEVEQERPLNQTGLGGHEFTKVVATLLSHTLDNLHLAQQQLEQWLSGSADSSAGHSILRLLEESSGAIQMLDQQKVSALLLQSANYLRQRVVEAQERPSEEEITNFADALAAVEIFLTSLRDKQGSRDDLLERADTKLSALGFGADAIAAPAPRAPRAPAPAPVAVPPPAPAAEAPPTPPVEPVVKAVPPAPPPVAPVAEPPAVVEPPAAVEPRVTVERTPEPEPVAPPSVPELTVSSDFDLADDKRTETPSISLDDSALGGLSLADADEEWSAPPPVSRAEPPPLVQEHPADEVTAAEPAAPPGTPEPVAPAAETPRVEAPPVEVPVAEAPAVVEPPAPVAPEVVEIDLGDSADGDFDLDGLMEAAGMLAPEAEAPSETSAPVEEAPVASITPAAEAVPVPDIDPEFLEIFLEEFDAEHEELAKAVPRLMDNLYDRDSLTDVRRSFHTLKGSGRMVGANEIGEFAWEIENLLNRVLDGHLSMTQALPLVGEAVALLPALKDRLIGQGLAVTADQAKDIAERAVALSEPKRQPKPVEPVAEEDLAQEALNQQTLEEDLGAEAEPVVSVEDAAEEPVETLSLEDEISFEELALEDLAELASPSEETESAPVQEETIDLEELDAINFEDFAVETDEATPTEPSAPVVQEPVAPVGGTVEPEPAPAEEPVAALDELSLAPDAAELPPLEMAEELPSATMDAGADLEVTLEPAASATQEPTVEESTAEEPAVEEMLVEEPADAAEMVQEEEDEDALDPTLAELIRAELAEHRATLLQYLADVDYRGWAEIPSQNMVRAVHTIAGNLGLAHRTSDTEALHLVERFLRELGAMRRTPEKDGIQLLRDTVRLTTQGLYSLGTPQAPVEVEAIDPGVLAHQAQTLLDALYRQLESDLSEQSRLVKAPLERPPQEILDLMADESAEAEAAANEAISEAPEAVQESAPASSELDEPFGGFDMEPFGEFDQAAEAGTDPWADALLGEAPAANAPAPADEPVADTGLGEPEAAPVDDAAVAEDFSLTDDFSFDIEEFEAESSAPEAPLPIEESIADVPEQSEPEHATLDAEALNEFDLEEIDLGEMAVEEIAMEPVESPVPEAVEQAETEMETPPVEEASSISADDLLGEADELEVSEDWLSEEDFAALVGEPLPGLAEEETDSAPSSQDAELVDAELVDDWLDDDGLPPLSDHEPSQEPLQSEEPAAAETPAPAAAETPQVHAAEPEALPEPVAQAAAPVAPVQPGLSEVDYEQLDPDLLDIFLGESEEILEEMDNTLQIWRDESSIDALNELKRHLHTLKGGARMAGLDVIGELGHELETMLEMSAPRGYAGADMDTIQLGCDELHTMLQAAYQRQPIPLSTLLGGGEVAAPAPAPVAMPEATEEAATAVAEEAAPAAAQAPAPAAQVPAKPAAPVEAAESRAPASDVVRVNALLLDNLVNYAGEISIFRSRLEQEVGAIRLHVAEVEETVQRLRDQLRKLELETEAQILSRFQREQDEPGHEFDPLELDRYSTIQQLSRALAESVNDLISLQEVLESSSSNSETLLLQQSRVNTELQEGLMQTRLVPFASLAPRLRRVVRRAAGETGRQARVDLDFQGGEGLLDRNVLERITAPLEHMLRNSVVHGIEDPMDRRSNGKDAEGVITITIDREATELLIRVRDDGRGIDPDKVRARAEKMGLTTPQAQLTKKEVLNFIFSSGFSTASQLTELAGRGVGMDVVYNEVRQLGGSVEIHTDVGKGTRFDIRIPLSLAVMQAIMVRAGDRIFAIPLTSVRGVAKMPVKDYLQSVDSTQPVYEYGGREYPILELEPQLAMEPLGVPDTSVPLLMIEAGDSRAALRVAELQTHREVVVKPVGPQISSIPGILGGTITGDGHVVIILDMGPLIRRGLSESRLPGVQLEYLSSGLEDTKRTPLVLVVDDSITMRKVTSRVLENRKLEVMTARDGLDAVEVMYDRIPDLILLDIEMPRMDGYELATHVRNDPRLRHIPMMIISSRTGEKHRQRGDEVGVNRYLGKPYREPELIKNVFELLEMDLPED